MHTQQGRKLWSSLDVDAQSGECTSGYGLRDPRNAEFQLEARRVSKTAEVEFEFITWISSEATVDFRSDNSRPSFSLFVDICK